jgi:hypothetical protein
VSWGTFWNAMAALAAAGAAYIAWHALQKAQSGLELAQRTLTEAQRARRITLSINLSERFSSDEMHAALAYLGRRRQDYGNDIDAMVAAYLAEVRQQEAGKLVEWNRCRRVVSKFFVTARALCEADLLEEVVLAEHLQKAAFDLYVDTVAVLDEAHTRDFLGRNDFDDRVRKYFSGFRVRHFERR